MSQASPDNSSKGPVTSSNNSRTITIVCAVVGGVLLIIAICMTFVSIARRRHRKRTELAVANDSENGISKTRFTHKSTPSNSSAPLLKEEPFWKLDESADDKYPPISYDHSYDHSSKEIQFYDYQPTTFAFDSTPFMTEMSSPKPNMRDSLPRLEIPERISLFGSTKSANYNPRASIEPIPPASPSTSACSDDTESLYSQPSASAHTPPAPNPVLPMAPLQRLPTRLLAAPAEDEDTHPKRSETRLVARMLKKRAERNPNKPTRSSSQVSRIERAGSIRPVESLTDLSGSYRRRLAEASRKTITGSAESSAEFPHSAAPSIAAGYSPLHDPTLPVQPPPSLRTTAHPERPSPPHDPIALIPILPHGVATNDALWVSH